ncbi:4-(cytidine 5'-diphospho)-2-C-methyl-D-erythritol kinase [Geomicrobium sp. JCM 19039]|uniref:4-(cytidine 5'-diphospho)-2-C-methyl-D-erythritol kinase n=1 Tax=Geomicrobium sp. JCM 19039 TaxID=1460636 RepID=UPI00045F2FD0|nr:4-(cytidine 5'-diphospho)-2-C-methyl-D-erythritol kinase [Geomicrobium sp. JCM 19039]GAK13888.1 4-diphosphocytidyl-2-C-methyl-D-erythritol kinase [Geomicrobium sp. JCM 19039]
MKCSLKAPAKINLSLDVLAKREDGFHEVEMIMTEVDLADRIDLTSRRDQQIVIQTHAGYIPADRRNLAYQAASLLRKRYRISAGVTIYIQKNIPVAAGLAGGSSDAAAVLRGLNQMWGLKLSKERLAELGSEIGSDIAFCVHGGTARATGRGEKIEHLPAPPACWVVLAKPPIGVSTADVYGRVRVTNPDPANTGSRAIEQAIRDQDYAQICTHLHNDLEQVTMKLYPEVGQIKERMLESGADAALMSGSGPTVFGLVNSEGKVHRVYNALRGFCDQVYAVRLIT